MKRIEKNLITIVVALVMIVLFGTSVYATDVKAPAQVYLDEGSLRCQERAEEVGLILTPVFKGERNKVLRNEALVEFDPEDKVISILLGEDLDFKREKILDLGGDPSEVAKFLDKYLQSFDGAKDLDEWINQNYRRVAMILYRYQDSMAQAGNRIGNFLLVIPVFLLGMLAMKLLKIFRWLISLWNKFRKRPKGEEKELEPKPEAESESEPESDHESNTESEHETAPEQ